MTAIVFIVLVFGAFTALALWRAPLWTWAVVLAVATLLVQIGVAFGPLGGISITKVLAWLPVVLLGVLSYKPVRREWITQFVYRSVKKAVPAVSPTEREALEAGTTGFDAELFSGEPDWKKLRAIAPMTLTDEERAFLDGPTEELCRMIDDWQIRVVDREVPEEVWNFVKAKGFLGMLISKEHGGLGFSAQAQSLVIGKIASRSPDVAVVVMVPNSLGPGELIEKFGTDQQKEYYLPRLARGEEVPCFALTGPFAGSDAASMRDSGVVVKTTHDGRDGIGIRLNWDKRYITLSPNATLLGVAFQLFDPDNILGRGENLGITVALVPVSHPGVRIGRRHLPLGNAFPNGPTWGDNVFISSDWIVGGVERAGQGWRMLMSCLAAGRAISLPASATAAAKSMLRNTSAYARVRQQFHIPIGRMEGIEAPLARIAEAAYVLEAARSVTASMVTAGEKPAVISALMKYKTTEWARAAVNDAMDIHGGKAICDGPSNYMQAAYQSIPVSITVEGANILTRSLMVIAQGALRSHPWLMREIEALQNYDQGAGFRAFEEAFEGHTGFVTANVFGALFHNITFGVLARSPSVKNAKWLYKQASRAARNFALVSDVTIAMLGGGLKTKQHITGRLADALAELYFLSAMLKRFEDDAQPERDLPMLRHSANNALHRFYAALDGVLHNFPVIGVGPLLRVLVFPLGNRFHPASDKSTKEIARLVLQPGAMRDALTQDIFINRDPSDPTGVLELAMAKVVETEEAGAKLERAVRDGRVKRYIGYDFIADAEKEGIITPNEAAELRVSEQLVSSVIAVDHFDAGELPGRQARAGGERPKTGVAEQPRLVFTQPPAPEPAPAPAPIEQVTEAAVPEAKPEPAPEPEPEPTPAPAPVEQAAAPAVEPETASAPEPVAEPVQPEAPAEAAPVAVPDETPAAATPEDAPTDKPAPAGSVPPTHPVE